MQQNDFERKVKISLDDSVNAIDADTRKRLAEIRRQSLQGDTQIVKSARWLALNYSHYRLPVFVTALAAGFAVLMLLSSNKPSINNQDHLAVLEVLDNAEDLEVISDPDFYLWADEALVEDAHAL